MKLLELVMIVKNSGEPLRSCLKINKKYIDYWTILDTGSTDNTIEIIEDELKDVPGKLFYSDFVDFATTRNKSLELSSKKCKYTIILDDSYVINGGEKLLKLLEKSQDECFGIKIGTFETFLENQYYSKRIIKTSKNLRYKYRVHEDIMSDKVTYIKKDDIFINDIEDYDHKLRSINRYKKDIELLLLDYENEPENPRIIYYLAKTYYNLENIDESLKFYDKLKQLKYLNEQYMFSALYESACIKYQKDDDINKFKSQLFDITNSFKDRVEAAYKLAILYRNEKHIKKADEIISKIILFKYLENPITIIETNIIDYYIPYLYIDTKIILGEIDKAVEMLKKMLNLYPNNQSLLNIKYALCNNLNISSIKLSNTKTIVFHAGGGKNFMKNWNPNGDKRISGSEYMLVNLAKEFNKIGYRVFIFSSFEDNLQKINYQGVYDNIEYIDYKYFSEFALKYIIDYLIISRYIEHLVYYDNIKSVYLWVHDVLPYIDKHQANGIQYHKTKFKGIISVSEWQKQNIVKKLNVPENNIILSRNAIYSERFIGKNIEKIPYRFIFSSSPDRGLKYLIQIIPKIKEKYNQTTLYLFVNQSIIDYETLQIINKLDYVYLNSRVSQEQLSIEFLKSDIWLYPTDFQETYCITALEAMASKCLVATVDYCGLGNIVKGRGILCENPIEKNIDDLINKLFFLLEKPKLKSYFIEKAYKWAIEQTYENLTKEWLKNIL